MSGHRKWTVHTSTDAAKTMLAWTQQGGQMARLAAQAQHCIDQLEIAGTRAGDAHTIGGVAGLWRIRNGNVRVYFDTAPKFTIAVGIVEHKKGENNQRVYEQYAKKVSEFKGTLTEQATKGAKDKAIEKR